MPGPCMFTDPAMKSNEKPESFGLQSTVNTAVAIYRGISYVIAFGIVWYGMVHE